MALTSSLHPTGGEFAPALISQGQAEAIAQQAQTIAGRPGEQLAFENWHTNQHPTDGLELSSRILPGNVLRFSSAVELGWLGITRITRVGGKETQEDLTITPHTGSVVRFEDGELVEPGRTLTSIEAAEVLLQLIGINADRAVPTLQPSKRRLGFLSLFGIKAW